MTGLAFYNIASNHVGKAAPQTLAPKRTVKQNKVVSVSDSDINTILSGS